MPLNSLCPARCTLPPSPHFSTIPADPGHLPFSSGSGDRPRIPQSVRKINFNTTLSMSKKAGMELARPSESFQKQDLAVVPKPDATKAEEPKARWPYMDPWPYIRNLPDGRRIIISRKNPPTEHPSAYTEMPPDDPGTFSEKSKLRLPIWPFPRARVTREIPAACMICSLVDEHSSTQCPYLDLLPKNATVSSDCDVVCTVCYHLFSGHCCNQDAGCAELRLCDNCMRIGDHRTSQCPEKNRRLSYWQSH